MEPGISVALRRFCDTIPRGFTEKQLFRKTHRCRGIGWLWQIHPDLPRQTLARTRRLPGLFYRVELLNPRQEVHHQRQEAPTPHADDFLSDSRDGFRRSLRTPDPAAPPRRLHRARRPLPLHRSRPGCRAGGGPRMGGRALQLCGPSRHHVLLPGAARSIPQPHPRRAPHAQIPRGRAGHGLEH